MSAHVEPKSNASAKAYVLEGTLLEACSCNILCPCWIGEDPDRGYCDAALAYHIDSGQINGIDVSGLTAIAVAHIPGNIFAGNWKVFRFVSDTATSEQVQALADAFLGKLGGPLADFAALVGEEAGFAQVPITYALEGGEGTMVVEGKVKAVMTPYKSAYGTTTTLRDSVFSTIPGSPAWVAKASDFSVDMADVGFKWTFHGGNAIQGTFLFQA